MSARTPAEDSLFAISQVRERYGTCGRTVARWVKTRGFPAPLYLNGRRRWRLGDLRAWEAANLRAAPEVTP